MTGSPVTYDFDMPIKTLSIFVDESGRFQYPDADSRFYILSMVLHNQEIDITDEVLHLDYKFRQMHLERLCFHAGPLIRQEKAFAIMDRRFRYRILAAMLAFARKVDFRYHCLVVDKHFATSSEQIVHRLGNDMRAFLETKHMVLGQFDRIKVYYDCGQSPVTNLLHNTFVAIPGVKIEFAQAVRPEKYRLFQLADLVCTVKLIEQKLECCDGMTPSELVFFGGAKSFKHNILRYLKSKEI